MLILLPKQQCQRPKREKNKTKNISGNTNQNKLINKENIGDDLHFRPQLQIMEDSRPLSLVICTQVLRCLRRW